MKKALKAIGILLLIIVLIVGGYFAYVFASYKRIEDKVTLSVDNMGTANEVVETGVPYQIMTYNIGFGAYTRDFSFFMDGGESSWAKSEIDLVQNITKTGTYINSLDTDFVIMQEVDTDGTRTYHVNEYKMFEASIGDGDYVFCKNFNSPFLMYPITQPHGANVSGIVTYSKYDIVSSLRRSLPVADSVKKIVDLDRCYSVSKVATEDGKYLCIYNVHLSAYGTDDTVRAGQLSMLFADLEADYAAGNYVICGGDFNHNLRDGEVTNAPGWAQQFPKSQLPEHFSMAFETFDSSDIEHDTCRDADKAWTEGGVLTVMVDGFIVSDNVKVISYQNIDKDFEYSDHDPVLMGFELIP